MLLDLWFGIIPTAPFCTRISKNRNNQFLLNFKTLFHYSKRVNRTLFALSIREIFSRCKDSDLSYTEIDVNSNLVWILYKFSSTCFLIMSYHIPDGMCTMTDLYFYSYRAEKLYSTLKTLATSDCDFVEILVDYFIQGSKSFIQYWQLITTSCISTQFDERSRSDWLYQYLRDAIEQPVVHLYIKESIECIGSTMFHIYCQLYTLPKDINSMSIQKCHSFGLGSYSNASTTRVHFQYSEISMNSTKDYITRYNYRSHNMHDEFEKFSSITFTNSHSNQSEISTDPLIILYKVISIDHQQLPDYHRNMIRIIASTSHQDPLTIELGVKNNIPIKLEDLVIEFSVDGIVDFCILPSIPNVAIKRINSNNSIQWNIMQLGPCIKHQSRLHLKFENEANQKRFMKKLPAARVKLITNRTIHWPHEIKYVEINGKGTPFKLSSNLDAKITVRIENFDRSNDTTI